MLRNLTLALKSFLSDKRGSLTTEYVTIAAIGSVVAIALMYQIGGGDDGRGGMAGLVNTLSDELDAAASNIEGSVSGSQGGGSEQGS